MTGNKIDVVLMSFTIHRQTKEVSWIKVKRLTLVNGTLLKYVKSGWYFSGIKNKHILSNIWSPFNEATPINKKSPNNTGIGIKLNIGAINTEAPIIMNTTICVNRCSLMPKNLGFSPGAVDSDSKVNDFTWLIAGTVEASHHGIPNIEQTIIIMATIKRSRWYPHPFCKKLNQVMNQLQFPQFLLFDIFARVLGHYSNQCDKEIIRKIPSSNIYIL